MIGGGKVGRQGDGRGPPPLEQIRLNRLHVFNYDSALNWLTKKYKLDKKS